MFPKKIDPKALNLKLKEYQADFAISEARYPAMIAGVGTGKTMFMLLKIWRFCETYPNTLALIVRKEFTDLRDSTIKDFEAYFGVALNANKEYRHPNGSVQMFRHGKELNVLKNINLTIFGIEQAEEFENNEAFTFLRDRLRRSNAPLRQGLIIANANGHNWIWELWLHQPAPKYDAVEATTYDNADNLPKDFLEDLTEMREEAPSHYRRYVMNSHDEADAVSVVITPKMIDDLENIRLVSPYIRRLVACDPSEGGDECVIKGFVNTECVEQRILHEKDQRIIAGEMQTVAVKINTNNYIVDTLGVGGQVVGILMERGCNVRAINSGEPAFEPNRFANRRTEMWWYAGDRIRQKQHLPITDSETKRQLCAVRYEPARNDRVIKLEPKKYTKKILRCSPDRGDCHVYGIWGLQYVQPDNAPQEPVYDYSKTKLQSSGRERRTVRV